MAEAKAKSESSRAGEDEGGGAKAQGCGSTPALIALPLQYEIHGFIY